MLFKVFVIVNVLDTLSTVLGLSMGLQENNPVAAAFLSGMGTVGLVAHKFLFLLLMYVGCDWIARCGYKRVARWNVGLGIAIITSAVVNNVVLIIG